MDLLTPLAIVAWRVAPLLRPAWYHFFHWLTDAITGWFDGIRSVPTGLDGDEPGTGRMHALAARALEVAYAEKEAFAKVSVPLADLLARRLAERDRRDQEMIEVLKDLDQMPLEPPASRLNMRDIGEERASEALVHARRRLDYVEERAALLQRQANLSRVVTDLQGQCDQLTARLSSLQMRLDARIGRAGCFHQRREAVYLSHLLRWHRQRDLLSDQLGLRTNRRAEQVRDRLQHPH